MNWREKKVLVTGATGLVGSWLCRKLLAEGADVATLVRDWNPRSEFIRSGDIRRCAVVSGSLEDYGAVERAILENEAEIVFHLGAQAIVGAANRSPLATFESNIRGSYNVLEACRVHRDLVKRVVVASSDKAYGDSDDLPYVEEMPAKGRHPYDVSKSCADLIASAYAATYGLPVAIARCGNIYGGGDLQWSRLIPGTIKLVLQNQRPVLRSDGTYTRDYIHVEDVVTAYMTLAAALDRNEIRGQAFNFSPEKPWTVLEVTALLLEVMGRKDLEPVIENTASAEIRDQYLDSTKARQLLGWTTQIPLKEGLAKTVEWYRNYLGGNFER
jgi:CDP-glucose 4,6-dehydratase